MSLETLMNIVSIDEKCENEDTFEMISYFNDIAGNDLFSFISFQSIGYEEDRFNKLIKILKEHDYVTEYFSYECELYEATELSENLPFYCEYCNKEVCIPDIHHIITLSYILSESFSAEINDYRVNLRTKYIHKDFLINFNNLKKDKNNIVPFLGSGISTPFRLPNWKKMFLYMSEYVIEEEQTYYKNLVEKGEFFKAITFMLKGHSRSFSTEKQIQQHIARLFSSPNLAIDEKSHNMMDIANINCEFFLTSNYDSILNEFITRPHPNPLCINDIEDVPSFFRERKKRVVHIHGIIDRPSTMIVTEENYNDLYNNVEFMNRLKAIFSHKKLVFIGFSFDDAFFSEFYRNIIASLGGEHYLIAANVHPFSSDEFNNNNLKTISLNLPINYSGQEYVNALRFVLQDLYK